MFRFRLGFWKRIIPCVITDNKKAIRNGLLENILNEPRLWGGKFSRQTYVHCVPQVWTALRLTQLVLVCKFEF